MKHNPLIRNYIATFKIHNEERLVLAETDRDFVVWNQNSVTGACFSGRYFRYEGEAKQRFAKDISRYINTD